MTGNQHAPGERPVASFVCITYNHVGMIGRCLDGFLAQRVGFPVEMIVLDDASTDGTREVLRRYAADYPGKFTLILPDINSAERRGNSLGEVIERARGRYVLVCEGDDYWADPGKVQTQVDFLEANPEFAFSFHDVVRVAEDGSVADQMVPPWARRDHSAREILRGCTVSFPLASMCFRNDLGLLPQEFFASPNGDLFLAVMLATLGAGAYQGAVVSPSRSSLHPGGVWSGASVGQRNAMAWRTHLNITSWMLRRGLVNEAQRLVGRELRLRLRVALSPDRHRSVASVMAIRAWDTAGAALRSVRHRP